MGKAVVGYLRVSTDKQGTTGLGVEAQRETLREWCAQRGRTLVAEFVEAESGRKCDRPQLTTALGHTRIHNATLVVAKMDRLSRNQAFLMSVIDSGVDVAFCDLPEASGPTGRFLLQTMAAVAELEAGLISQRTKAAMAAYKARGGLLGGQLPQCRNLTPEGREVGNRKSCEVNRRKADEHYGPLYQRVLTLRSEGFSLKAVADLLNSEHVPTRAGALWSAVQVKRVADKALRHREVNV